MLFIASVIFSICFAFSKTFSWVDSRMQSNRRITVSGRITNPYSWGLYEPVSFSAIFQRRFAFSVTFDVRDMLFTYLVQFIYSIFICATGKNYIFFYQFCKYFSYSRRRNTCYILSN